MPSTPSLTLRHCLALLPAVALMSGCTRPEPPPEPIRAVRTVTLALDSTAPAREFAAEVRARNEVRLAFRVGGKLTERPAEVGQRVKAGQVLARLDPQDLRLSQEAARAAVRAARTGTEQALADFGRFKELFDQGFISAAELDRRKSTRDAALAQLDQAQAQASVQGNQASYSTLLATQAGVVTAVDAEVGAVLAAGTPVLRLAVDGPRDAVFSVPEDMAAGLRQLQDVPGALTMRGWGRTAGAPVPVTVREVAAAADPATRTFLVKADLGAAPVQLGQTGTVVLQLPPAAGVARLPLTAVTRQQGVTSVWVVDPATMAVRLQPIKVGAADGNMLVVDSGLSPGQRIVTAGVHVLTPGQKVKFYVEPVAAAASR